MCCFFTSGIRELRALNSGHFGIDSHCKTNLNYSKMVLCTLIYCYF